jgi:hypothetical protein
MISPLGVFVLLLLISFPSLAQFGGEPRWPMERQVIGWPCARCYPTYQDSKMAVSYGALHKTIGIDLFEYLPTRYIPLPYFPITNLEWRSSFKGDSYLHLSLMRDVGRINGDVHFGPRVGFKNVRTDSTKINQFVAGLNFSDMRQIFFVGYVHQTANKTDYGISSDDGINMRMQVAFFNQLEVTASVTCWFDRADYSLRVVDYPFCDNFILGVGFERINDWNELSFSIGFFY